MAKKNKTPVAEMDAQQLAIHKALKAKKDKKKAEKREALVECLKFVKENGDEILQAMAAKLLPRSEGGVAPTREGGSRASVRDLLLGLMPEVGSVVTEDQVWTALKLGRAEMRKKSLLAIKKAEPADRLWVSFSAVAGTYTLAGIGPLPPEGWLGYVPMDVDA